MKEGRRKGLVLTEIDSEDSGDYDRAKFVAMFGPRRPGDAELLVKYPEVVERYGPEVMKEGRREGMVFTKIDPKLGWLLGLSVGLAIGLATVAYYIWLA